MFKKMMTVALASALLMSGSAYAASISVYLDQSNTESAFADGTNYLQVTISDGVDGAIDFTVETLGPLADIGGSNYGIQSFSFNFGDTGASLDNIVAPDGWSVRGDQNHSGYGRFDAHLAGLGNNRQDALTFSIVGISGDMPTDYIALFSSGNAGQGNQLFAAHVAGFDGPHGITSAQFGGTTVVPLPASAWLFGSGLVFLGSMRLRKRAANTSIG